MGLVNALRELWSRRLLVVGAGLLALVVFAVVAYDVSSPTSLDSRRYEVGVASASALVDTPSSQLVDLGLKKGIDASTLPTRAALLASLMVNSPLKERIAIAARVDPRMLIVSAPAEDGAATPVRSAPVPEASISPSDPKANILRTSVPNLPSGQLPVITVATQAPTAATAARLADESIAVLRRSLRAAADDGAQRVPDRRRLVLRPLGQARSATETRGPGFLLAIVAGLCTFVLACCAILFGTWLIRTWRLAGTPGGPEDDPGPSDHDFVDLAFLDDHEVSDHRSGERSPSAAETLPR